VLCPTMGCDIKGIRMGNSSVPVTDDGSDLKI
jgi:hypothetical protein